MLQEEKIIYEVVPGSNINEISREISLEYEKIIELIVQ